MEKSKEDMHPVDIMNEMRQQRTSQTNRNSYKQKLTTFQPQSFHSNELSEVNQQSPINVEDSIFVDDIKHMKMEEKKIQAKASFSMYMSEAQKRQFKAELKAKLSKEQTTESGRLFSGSQQQDSMIIVDAQTFDVQIPKSDKSTSEHLNTLGTQGVTQSGEGSILPSVGSQKKGKTFYIDLGKRK